MAHRLARRELLNALVEGIDDEEVATAIERKRVWGGELTWLDAVLAELGEKFSLLVEDLHAMVVVIGDEDRLLVNRDPDREFKLAVARTFPSPSFREGRRSNRFLGNDGCRQQPQENSERYWW